MCELSTTNKNVILIPIYREKDLVGGEKQNNGIYGNRRNNIIATPPKFLRSFHSRQDDICVPALFGKEGMRGICC